MQVVVTGAGTPFGQVLLREVVLAGSLVRSDGQRLPVHRILAADSVQPPGLFLDDRIEYVRGDLAQPRFLARMMGTITDSIFHIVPPCEAAAAPEGAPFPTASLTALAEHAALEHELEVSFDVTRMLVEACSFQQLPPRLVYVSEFPGAGAGNLLSAVLAAEAGRHGIVQACAVVLPLAQDALVECARRMISAHDTAPARSAPRASLREGPDAG
jgi:hypothetical protein